MTSLLHDAPAVQPDSPRDRPILVPPETEEFLDPFAEDFTHYPDEAPELPLGAEFDAP